MGVKITFVRGHRQEPTVRVEAEGYVGNSCEAATARISRALGLQISDEKKPAYYETVVAEQSVTEGQG